MIVFIATGPLKPYSAEHNRAAAEQQWFQEKHEEERTVEERLTRLRKRLYEISAKAAIMTALARKDMSLYRDIPLQTSHVKTLDFLILSCYCTRLAQ